LIDDLCIKVEDRLDKEADSEQESAESISDAFGETEDSQTHPMPVESEQLPTLIETEPTQIISNEPEINHKTLENNLAEPRGNPDSFIAQQQQIYISMLQQQIAALQSQISSIGFINQMAYSRPTVRTSDCGTTTDNVTFKTAAAQTDVEAVMKKEACCETSFHTMNPLRETSTQTEMTTETKPTACQNHSEPSMLSSKFSKLAVSREDTINLDVNFVPFYETNVIMDTAEGPNIIAKLVDDPEKSFLYSEVNQETMLENEMIFAKAEMADNRDVEYLQDKDSVHVETFSLASLEYLKKYGLES
jgi:Rod binding domain-containing protein